MKNSICSRRLLLVILSISLIFVVGTVSEAQSRVTKYARFAASTGWTLKQKIFYTPAGGVQQLIGKYTLFFQGRDRWVRLHYGRGFEDSFTLMERLIFIPQASFRDNRRDEQLSSRGEPTDIFFGVDIDESVLQTDKNFIADVSILGWKCAVLRGDEEKDQITYTFRAYHLGGFPIGYNRFTPQGLEVVEPVSITLGPIAADLNDFPSDWPVDFSWYEQTIQNLEQIRPREVPAMKEILSRARARFQKKQN
jgi:hypothetical protein